MAAGKAEVSLGVAILILTKNEERDLPACPASVAWSDDVHLYDSYSTDATVSTAECAGAHVVKRVFDNWAAHQDWGLRNIKLKYPWVFYIDADERMTPQLGDAVIQAARSAGEQVALRVQRRDFFHEYLAEACAGFTFLHVSFST